jgi:transcriptional regulator with XRE-family HTH domain
VTVGQRFGANLFRLREQSGITQEQLSFRAGLHRTEIGLLERGGRIPKIDTAAKLAGSLGVTLAALLDGIEWSPGEFRPGYFRASGEAGP